MTAAMWQPEPLRVIEKTPDVWAMRKGVWTLVSQGVWTERLIERKPVDLSKLIACPTCRATVLQSCRVLSGKTKGRVAGTPHRLRLAPRLCPCGSTLAPHRQLCEPCALRSLRESKRDYMRRQRAAARRTVAA